MTSPDLPETADPDLCRRVRVSRDALSASATAQPSNARQSTLKEWAYSPDKRPIHRLRIRSDGRAVLDARGQKGSFLGDHHVRHGRAGKRGPAEARRARGQFMRLRARIEACADSKYCAAEFEGIPPDIILRGIDFRDRG